MTVQGEDETWLGRDGCSATPATWMSRSRQGKKGYEGGPRHFADCFVLRSMKGRNTKMTDGGVRSGSIST